MITTEPHFIGVGSIAECTTNRLAVLAELQTRMAVCQRREQELQKHLIAKAPEPLKKLLVDHRIVQKLFEYGRAEEAYEWGAEGDHFKTAKEIKDAFGALPKAWRGNVAVEFDESGVNPIRVYLKATSFPFEK